MQKGRVAVFFLVVLAIWTAMNAYVFWRISSVEWVSRHLPRLAVILVAALLWASYIAARFLERAGIRSLAQWLEWIGAHWLGVAFLAFVCFLAVDLVAGFGYWLPAGRLRSWALLAAAVLAVISFVQARRAPVISTYEVRMPGLPRQLDGTTMAVLSDTHLGTMIGSAWLDRRVAEVNALHPDLVVLAGDIIEGDDATEEEKIVAGLKGLSAPMGVWAVTGNHEFYAGVGHSLRLFHLAGVGLLRDEWRELRPGLVLAGVDDLTARRQRGSKAVSGFLERALNGRPAGATVLISHSPMYPKNAAGLGAGLMVSGHTHNGQIWPFRYIVRATYPLVSGRYSIGQMTAIVCRGTGTWGPRMRLWQRGEILKIVLRANS